MNTNRIPGCFKTITMRKHPLMFLLAIPLFVTAAYLFYRVQSRPPSYSSTSFLLDEQSVAFEGQGIAVGIREKLDEMFWRTYEVSANDPFRGYFYLLNQQEAETYLLTCLIDYIQHPCTYNGEKQMRYRIVMGKNEQRDIAFETPELHQGFHDLMILAIAKPDEHDLSEDFRYSTDFNYLYASRAVVLADNTRTQSPTVEYIPGAPQPDRLSPLNGVVVNQDDTPGVLRAWLYQKTKAGDILEYFIHLGNDAGPSYTYAVMSFLDYQQIPLNDEYETAFVSLPAGTGITLSGYFEAPQDAGIYELMVVIVRNPYQLLEDPVSRRLTQSTGVESSIRIAIEVTP